MFATNSAFRHVDHPEFIKLMEMLRPGYSPPNRHQIGNELLDDVHNTIVSEMHKSLGGGNVCMALDGWSNIHMEPIVCVSVTDVLDQVVYLVDSIDTADKSHTANYMLTLATEAIKKCQQYNCSVTSFVTDNAKNMAKMRSDLAKTDKLGSVDIITYGCSAHLLNLLAKDIEIPEVKQKVKRVMKYFRNHHFPAAKYKQAGGQKLVLPQDVRWNTLADCLESYSKNWPVLSSVCSENRAAIDVNITSIVFDMDFKTDIEEYLKKLKIISVALDKVQADNCTIGGATDIWIEIVKRFKEESEIDQEHCMKRFKVAITPAHFLAHILDPRFTGKGLLEEQLDEAMEYANSYHPGTIPDILKYRGRASPFKEYLFTEQALEGVKPLTWWLALENNNLVKSDTIKLAKQLHSAVSSSAGIERVFSSFGLVHSKIRNRLGTEKASKLVAIFKHYNRMSRNE